MSASLNQSSFDLAIRGLYSDYVWDTAESSRAEESDVEQELSEPEKNLDLQEEPEPSDYGQDEEEGLFQSNLVSCYLREVSQFQLLSLEKEIELARTIKEGEERLVNLVVTHCTSLEIFGNLRSKILRWQSEVARYEGMTIEGIPVTELLNAAPGNGEDAHRAVEGEVQAACGHG